MKTIVSAWVDVSVAMKLDEAVASKKTTRSAIVLMAVEHFLDQHIADAVLPSRQPTFGNVSDRDGLDARGIVLIKANMDRTIRATRSVLMEAGIKRSTGWIAERKCEIRNPVVGIK